MTEQDTVPESAEARSAAVESWVKVLTAEGKVGPISQELMAASLSDLEANFEPRPELAFLAEYTNKAKRPGMDAVWGLDRVNEFKAWAADYAERYEAEHGVNLPALEKKGSKTSGMLQFFGEITAFAAGKLAPADLKRFLETRSFNGKMWLEGRKDERVRIQVPTVKEPILPSSFPPGFPAAAWEKISSWRK